MEKTTKTLKVFKALKSITGKPYFVRESNGKIMVTLKGDCNDDLVRNYIRVMNNPMVYNKKLHKYEPKNTNNYNTAEIIVKV